MRYMDLISTDIHNRNDDDVVHNMYPFAGFVSMRAVAYLLFPEAPVNEDLSW